MTTSEQIARGNLQTVSQGIRNAVSCFGHWDFTLLNLLGIWCLRFDICGPAALSHLRKDVPCLNEFGCRAPWRF